MTSQRHIESQLQRQCVAWFRLQYPKHAKLLFAVPNGGARSRVEAAIMKAEGVTSFSQNHGEMIRQWRAEKGAVTRPVTKTVTRL